MPIADHLAHDHEQLIHLLRGEDSGWLIEDEQRRAAKTLNFGVLYGMGPNNFARAAGISVEEARSFIDRYRKQYVGLNNLIAATIAQAEELGYVETLFGRRRPVAEINARSPELRSQAERIAFNFPIQGSAADILKKAMIASHAHFSRTHPRARLLLTVGSVVAILIFLWMGKLFHLPAHRGEEASLMQQPSPAMAVGSPEPQRRTGRSTYSTCQPGTSSPVRSFTRLFRIRSAVPRWSWWKWMVWLSVAL